MDWLYRDLDNMWVGVFASALILIAVICVVRVAGVRTLAKMTSIDFAVTVALGSILGATATGSVSVLQGVVAIVALVGLQALLAVAVRHWELADRLIENKPLLLMDRQEILEENMKHCRMARSELYAKLREANVLNRSQVRAVILETTGDVSVLHSKDVTAEVEEWLLKDVRRIP